MSLPPSITENEFFAKLSHLKNIVVNHSSHAIYLESEGAMRWLTGKRHQVIDIHPSSQTTISAIISFDKNSYSLNFYSDPWEQNRLNDFLKNPMFQSNGVKSIQDTMDHLQLTNSIINPRMKEYREIEREIVSPLIENNQYKKLEFLVTNSREALLEVAHKVNSGMDGWTLRSLVYESYHKRHLELNQVILALDGMSSYQHPMVEDDSVVKEGSIIKIVTGSRFFDMFHSATQLVKIDNRVTNEENYLYHALQEMAIEYAKKFIPNTSEELLYASLIPIATTIEEKYNISNFKESAHIHHAGGPLSPLGNRDFVITQNGTRKIFPYTQFSINPVDSILHLKCELQGVVIPDDSPMILDEFTHTDDKNEYMTMQYKGKDLRLPTIIVNNKELMK